MQLHRGPTTHLGQRHGRPALAEWLGPARGERTRRLRPCGSHEAWVPEHAKEMCLSGEPNSLTKRQLEILRLLAEGRSTDEIATELGLSRTTVRNYIATLLAALGAHTRLQAVVVARRAGIIDA
jgi:DNA-binding NarL/FixJ family response regulator